MLCAMRRPQLPTVEEVCATARCIAVLEYVMNPTNVGAIFRSAAALGMDAVLLTSAGSDPLYRRASRVSMGKRLSHPVDVPAGGRLGRAAARAGLSDGGDGAAGRLAHAV